MINSIDFEYFKSSDKLSVIFTWDHRNSLNDYILMSTKVKHYNLYEFDDLSADLYNKIISDFDIEYSERICILISRNIEELEKTRDGEVDAKR